MAERRNQTGSAIDSRERILASAAHTFATYGYRKTTFEEIAAGAGVSRTLVYRHFANKVTLLRAVRDRALDEWGASVVRAVEPSDSALETLEALIGETLRFAAAHPIFRAFLAGDARLALHGEPPDEAHSKDAWLEQIATLLDRAVAAGELATVADVRVLADVLCDMQLGVIDQMHDAQDPGPAIGPAHVGVATQILIGGLTRRPADGRQPRAVSGARA